MVATRLALLALLLVPGPMSGQDAAGPVDAFFAEEVWAKVGERTCLNCHTGRGEAAESEFLLRETELDPDALRHNRDAFGRMAAARKDGTSKILLKASGGVKHGGGPQLKPGSTGYKILE